MNTVINRITIFFFSLLLLAAAALSAYLQQTYWLALPFVVLGALYFVQHPKYLLYLLVASIPWSIEYNFTSSLGTDLPDEPLMLLSMGSVLVWLVYQRRSITANKFHPLLWVVIFQFAWSLVAALASTDIILSIKYVLSKCWYLAAFLVAPVLIFREKEALKKTAIILAASMLAFMLLAMFRHAQNGWTFENINKSLEPFFRNHVNYSALLVFTVPLQVACIQLVKDKRIVLVLKCILFITIGALYFSYARGAWLALVTGGVSYWLLRKRLLLPSFVLLMLFTIGMVFWFRSGDRYLKYANDYRTTIFHTNFQEHLLATYQGKDVSTAERYYRWVAGVRMIKDRWLTGFGPSTFYENYKSYTVPAFKTWVSKNEEHSTVHNYFLFVLVEQGVPGFLLFVLLLGLAFSRVQKIYHEARDPFWKITIAAAGALLVMECTINFLSDMVETDKAGGVFYLCIAAIIAADRHVQKQNSDAAPNVERIS